MAEYVPQFKPGAAVTFRASKDVKGGQVVEITGDRAVAPTTAASKKVAGIAGFDAKTGDDVTVYSGAIQRPTASATIAAGDRVASAADGKVATATTDTIGLALTAAAAGETAQVRFDLA